jgi:hypothetical protein
MATRSCRPALGAAQLRFSVEGWTPRIAAERQAPLDGSRNANAILTYAE